MDEILGTLGWVVPWSIYKDYRGWHWVDLSHLYDDDRGTSTVLVKSNKGDLICYMRKDELRHIQRKDMPHPPSKELNYVALYVDGIPLKQRHLIEVKTIIDCDSGEVVRSDTRKL